MKTFIILSLLFFTLNTSGASRAKVCPEAPAGATLDKNCNLVPVSQPLKKQSDAVVKAQVTDVQCSLRTKDSQSYIATIKVLEKIRGEAPSTFKITFSRNLDGHYRPGDRRVSFLKGDIAELSLTKNPQWDVVDASDIKLIIGSRGLHPKCDGKKY